MTIDPLRFDAGWVLRKCVQWPVVVGLVLTRELCDAALRWVIDHDGR